jgi:hypothetical protein
MNTKNKILLFGSLIGAVTGLVAAMLLNRRVQEDTTEIVISPGEGMKVGVLVFGLLRAIASLGDDN